MLFFSRNIWCIDVNHVVASNSRYIWIINYVASYFRFAASQDCYSIVASCFAICGITFCTFSPVGGLSCFFGVCAMFLSFFYIKLSSLISSFVDRLCLRSWFSWPFDSLICCRNCGTKSKSGNTNRSELLLVCHRRLTKVIWTTSTFCELFTFFFHHHFSGQRSNYPIRLVNLFARLSTCLSAGHLPHFTGHFWHVTVLLIDADNWIWLKIVSMRRLSKSI